MVGSEGMHWKKENFIGRLRFDFESGWRSVDSTGCVDV